VRGFLKTWTTDQASAERFWSRARLKTHAWTTTESTSSTEIDAGISFATATRASQAFAAAEPDLVELYLRGWEERLRAECFEPLGEATVAAWARARALNGACRS
jgi:hypothetical protein